MENSPPPEHHHESKVADADDADYKIKSRSHAVEMISGLENELEIDAVTYILRRLLKIPTGYEESVIPGNRTFILDASKNFGLKIKNGIIDDVREHSQAELVGLREDDKLIEIGGKVASEGNIRHAIARAKSRKANLSVTVIVKEKEGEEPKGPWLNFPRTPHIFSSLASNIKKKERKMVMHLRHRLLTLVDDLSYKEARRMLRCMRKLARLFPCPTCSKRKELSNRCRPTSLESKKSARAERKQRARTVNWGPCDRCKSLSMLLEQRMATKLGGGRKNRGRKKRIKLNSDCDIATSLQDIEKQQKLPSAPSTHPRNCVIETDDEEDNREDSVPPQRISTIQTIRNAEISGSSPETENYVSNGRDSRVAAMSVKDDNDTRKEEEQMMDTSTYNVDQPQQGVLL
mmetsp:Transcript_44367/g.74009  ORF Transcript_44367/g.74009 Transcript_44367/m.74009 type:complete len:403 (+) Transcript_44367:549-1757(+)